MSPCREAREGETERHPLAFQCDRGPGKRAIMHAQPDRRGAARRDARMHINRGDIISLIPRGRGNGTGALSGLHFSAGLADKELEWPCFGHRLSATRFWYVLTLHALLTIVISYA